MELELTGWIKSKIYFVHMDLKKHGLTKELVM